MGVREKNFRTRNDTQMNTDETDSHGFMIEGLSVLISSIRINPRAIPCLYEGYLTIASLSGLSDAIHAVLDWR